MTEAIQVPKRARLIQKEHEDYTKKNGAPPPNKLLKWASFLAFFAVWIQYTTPEQKVQSFVLASVYACIEFSWKALTSDETGVVLPTSLGEALGRGHTTLEQFFTNIWWAPIGLDLYYYYMPNRFLRILFGPLNIWTFEIIIGYYLLFIWGKRAWHYEGRLVYFHGNIVLTYLPVWYLFSIVHEILMVYFYPQAVEFLLSYWHLIPQCSSF